MMTFYQYYSNRHPCVYQVGDLHRGSGALVPAGAGSAGLPGNGASIMEASVLLHNITRIVQVGNQNSPF